MPPHFDRLQIGCEIGSLRGLLGGARSDPLQVILHGGISSLRILLGFGHHAIVGQIQSRILAHGVESIAPLLQAHHSGR